MTDRAREQHEHWNGPGGQRWVNEQERLDRVLAPLGTLAIESAAPRAGERVIDIGCGCGASTLELGTCVGSGGSVLGVDISAPMLARARERARAQRLDWVSFAEGDATTYAFGGDADLVFSRFGSMFFPDPPAAFANLRRALRPGGRLRLITWRRFEENAWGRVPLEAALTVLGPQPPPPPPGSPGPFGLSSEPYVRELLSGAGFAQVSLEAVDRTLEVSSRGLEEAVSFSLHAGPAARVLLGADPDTIARVTAAVRKALEPYLQGERVQLGAAAWIVSGVAAG
jgi:SAM-dependent methyltransferase